MSQSLLAYSMLEDAYFPASTEKESEAAGDFSLRRLRCFDPSPQAVWQDMAFAVFDLETTGLDSRLDRIIEIGALKVKGGQVVGTFESFVDPQQPIPLEAQKVSGITQAMVAGQPLIDRVLPDFLNFVDGCILVAHNAVFDMGFLQQSASQLHVDLRWASFCTLKLAREFLPELERKTLDVLAAHYGLQFEARHRSIGDAKVTLAVLTQLLKNEGAHLTTWADFAPFTV